MRYKVTVKDTDYYVAAEATVCKQCEYSLMTTEQMDNFRGLVAELELHESN